MWQARPLTPPAWKEPACGSGVVSWQPPAGNKVRVTLRLGAETQPSLGSGAGHVCMKLSSWHWPSCLWGACRVPTARVAPGGSLCPPSVHTCLVSVTVTVQPPSPFSSDDTSNKDGGLRVPIAWPAPPRTALPSETPCPALPRSRTSVGPGASVAAPLLLTVLSPGTRPHAPSCVDFCSSGDLSQRGVLPRDSAGRRLLPSLQLGAPLGLVSNGTRC